MADSKFEAFVLYLIKVLKTDISDYCDLETVDGDTLVASDGSLATIVKFDGIKCVLGRDQFEQLIAQITQSLAIYFKTKGHQLQVVFRRDFDASATLNANAAGQHKSADRLRLDVHDLIDENVNKYMQYVYDEECYFVFWSRPMLLDRAESKISQQEINEFRKEANWPSLRNGQNILRPIRFLYSRHQSFVSKICEDFQSSEYGCAITKLDVQEMLRTVRRSAFPDYTHENWRASIPGEKIPMRWKTNTNIKDGSEMLYPSLPSQIMVGMGEIGTRESKQLPDPTTIRIGGRIYAPMLVEIPPSEPQYFNNLFNALNRAETTENDQIRALPYAISFMLESDGMSMMGLKSVFANVLGITSQVNRNINLALKELRERLQDGESIVKLRIAAMTWASTGVAGARELTLRKSKLWKTMESWGGGKLIERTGNPMLTYQSCCIGLTWKHIGNPAPAPLGEALAMLPFTRPASPFTDGSTILRSLDGKILKYQRFSSEQSTWITLYAGKPGSGKSVMSNNNNFELCLIPGLTRLPYICCIDIGISSSGFIDLVRDNLPDDQKHLVIYRRLQNTVDYCINILDTPLGNRQPLSRDRNFQVNFLSTLVTPPERKGTAYTGMSDFISRVLFGAYKLKSDQIESAQPETYKKGFDPLVDQAVEKINFPIMPATSYWELVDAFFQAGMFHEAEVAQRHAVPTFNDLIAYAASPDIKNEYGSYKVENGMPINEVFILGLREAINSFPMFSSYTRFDIGSARVMALDLQDVAIIGSDAASKQTALMYMIARQSFMKKIAFSKEDLPYFEPMYRRYYERLINDIIEDKKTLFMDEFHKAGKHPILLDQTETDGREGRKWNLELVLGSQLMDEYGKLTELATAIFILDAGTEETRKKLRNSIGLSPVEENALKNYVHGAGPHGTTFLARFITKTATYTQLYTSSIGPMRLWALSTTSEDRKLRSLLYSAMPGNEARALLAQHFPSGSCKKLVEKLQAEMNTDADFIDEEITSSVIERIAENILSSYYGKNSNHYKTETTKNIVETTQ
jgi:intracellular multiplication protein IcmB